LFKLYHTYETLFYQRCYQDHVTQDQGKTKTTSVKTKTRRSKTKTKTTYLKTKTKTSKKWF